jgi:voltage-gated potassium channel
MRVVRGQQLSLGALAWQLVVLVLSLITLLFVALDTLFLLSEETSELFFILDTLICLVFLADVFHRGVMHPDRRRYWRWGWLDLLSSIPAITFLRWGRLLRIIRIVRVLRAFRSTRSIVSHLFADPAQGSLFTVALATFALVVFGSVAILNVEAGITGTTIESASDALWWSFVTVTTVGYGDHYPVTDAGRLIAAVLMSAGVGLFGTLTAYFANAWIRRQSEPAPVDIQSGSGITAAELRGQLQAISDRLERLEANARERGGGS